MSSANKPASVVAAITRYQKDLVRAASNQALSNIRNVFDHMLSGIRYGVVTALQKETDAVLDAVSARYGSRRPRAIPVLGTAIFYYFIEIRVGGRARTFVVCQCVEMGNNSSAISATSLLKDFIDLEHLFMVGIAGGVPATAAEIDAAALQRTPIENHVRLGDLVISTEGVFQYDHVKRDISDYWISRAKPKIMNQVLYSVAQQIRADLNAFEPELNTFVSSLINAHGFPQPIISDDILDEFSWDAIARKLIVVRHISHPLQNRRVNSGASYALVHFGLVGSANILLKDPLLRDELRTKRSICAVEMESSGLADAAWSFHRGYIAIRGICDYCDPNKNEDWQTRAAYVAAGGFVLFAERLI